MGAPRVDAGLHWPRLQAHRYNWHCWPVDRYPRPLSQARDGLLLWCVAFDPVISGVQEATGNPAL
eukprot:711809-Prorocentrum_lima.AAC.1